MHAARPGSKLAAVCLCLISLLAFILGCMFMPQIRRQQCQHHSTLNDGADASCVIRSNPCEPVISSAIYNRCRTSNNKGDFVAREHVS